MDKLIQKNIDSGNGIIILPPGEYQGTFYVDHPCIIEGNGTTLWNCKETVFIITSDGVTLKNIRIELIEPLEDAYSVCTSSPVVTDNVEIIGRTSGFGEEDFVPEMNKQLKLGKFASENSNTFICEIYSPGIASLETKMQDIALDPVNLVPGINRVKISTANIPHGTFIYGDLMLKSSFLRRFYVQGTADQNSEILSDRIISVVDQEKINEMRARCADFESARMELINKASVKRNAEETNSASGCVEVHTRELSTETEHEGPYILARGERINIDQYSGKKLKVYMSYRALFKDIDIDPYAFMLDETGVTSCDDDFVFFGNRETMSGALTFNEDKSIEVDLTRVPNHIKKISFVYSIYKPGPNDNFSKVMDPFISVVQNNREIVRYTASELFAQTTIIFLEMYKHNSGWKMNTIGQGYREGLKRLCASYGLIVS